MLKAVWPDSFVEESSLAQNVFQLRKALGEGAGAGEHYIETIPKRGYCFVADIFEIQDSISEQVSRALALKLSSDERTKLAKRYTDNTEAYQAYIKGRYFWDKRTDEGLQKGIEHFQKAIELDPTYALAYAGLADSYNMLSYYGNTPPAQNFPRARTAATRALELDDTLAEAHTCGTSTIAPDFNRGR